MTSITTRSQLDKDLNKLRANIVRLSSMVETAIEQSVLALETHALDIARQVIANDVELNALRYEVEESALILLATQRPAAGDLRNVIAAIHIAVELERMGDHAVGIANLVERIEHAESAEGLYQIPKMAKRARKMIRLAIDAYVSQDEELAKQMMARDQKINKGYDKLFGFATTEMRDDDNILRGTYLLWIGHNLERIGDRAVNIAERVIFMVTGDFTESSTTDVDIE